MGRNIKDIGCKTAYGETEAAGRYNRTAQVCLRCQPNVMTLHHISKDCLVDRWFWRGTMHSLENALES
jgi:hypothetical protein